MCIAVQGGGRKTRQSETGGDPGIKIFMKPRPQPRAPPASTAPSDPPALTQQPRSRGTEGLAERRPPQGSSFHLPDAAAGEVSVISAGALARLRRASGLIGESSDSGNVINDGNGGGSGGGTFSDAAGHHNLMPPAGSAALPQQFRQPPYDPHSQHANGGTGISAASYQPPGYGLPGALCAANVRYCN